MVARAVKIGEEDVRAVLDRNLLSRWLEESGICREVTCQARIAIFPRDAGAAAHQGVRDVGGGKLLASVKDTEGNVIGLIQAL